MTPLAVLEEIIDAAGTAPAIEALLQAGARGPRLAARTLLLGMMLALADGRPAHLTRVHQALTALPEADQQPPGVLADWKNGPHRLTYRQAEYTFGLVTGRARQGPARRAAVAGTAAQSATGCWKPSVRTRFKNASASLAVAWSDLESFSRPPPHGGGDCADPEASWGHRKDNLRKTRTSCSSATTCRMRSWSRDEHGPPVPELARRMRPVVLPAQPRPRLRPRADHHARMLASRSATSWPTPATPTEIPAALGIPAPPGGRRPGRGPAPPRPRPQGHSSRRGHRPTGTSTGPAAPRALLELGPLSRAATPAQAAQHDARDRRGLPATSSAASPPTTPTATTGSSARPPRARSAAPLRPPRCDWTGTGPRSSTPQRTPGLLRPADHHRPAGRPCQDPRRNTTTRRLPGAAPTPAAAAPSAASPPPRTPPATTSAAAGAA